MSDVSDLFDRNPLDLTEDDIRTLVTHLRERRHQFTAGNLKAGSTKKPTEKQQKVLDDAKALGLDLDI